MARLQRQQAEILSTFRAGDLRRAVALAREHLAEFPNDTAVRRTISDHVARCGDDALRHELRELLADVPA